MTWEIGAIFSGSPCELPYPSHPIRVARKGRGMSEGSWTLPCTRLASLGAFRRNTGIDDEHIIWGSLLYYMVYQCISLYIYMMDMLYRYVGILFFTIYITIEWGCNLCNCSVFWQNCLYFQRYSSSYSLDELETPPIVSNCQILSSYFDYWDCDVLNTIHDDCCSTPKSQIDAYIHFDQEIPRVTKIDIKDHKHR